MTLENSLLASVRAAAGNPVGAGAPGAPAPGASVSAEAHTAGVNTARAEGEAAGRSAGHAAGMTEGHAAGVAAERARVGGILNHAEANGRDTLAKELAFGTDLSVDAAVKVLAAGAKAAPDQGSTFLAEREGRQELKLEPEAGKDPKAETDDLWNGVAAKLNAGLPNR